MLYDRLDDGAVRVPRLPAPAATSRPGKSGACRARVNRDGTLYAITYGRVCSVAADPIEKKPLYHFFPGTTVLSLGSVGLQLHLPPLPELADRARRPGRARPATCATCPSATCRCWPPTTSARAWPGPTTSPPSGSSTSSTAPRLAHEHGLYTVMVTNGYITEEALDVLAPHIDAYRVDVKGFSDEQYKELCRIPDMPPVLEPRRCAPSRARLPRRDRHQRHPDVQRRRGDAAAASPTWIVAELGPETPWHVTRFMPYLEFAHLPPTPIPTLERAVRIGHDAGLDFVYLGNVPGHEGENTVCPNCQTPARAAHRLRG